MYHRVFLLVHCLLLLFSLSSAMDGLRVASLNMNGGRDRKKRAVTKELFQQKKLDVILLQETHSDSDNETEWALWTDVSCVLSH